jgi:hypothetical protein
LLVLIKNIHSNSSNDKLLDGPVAIQLGYFFLGDDLGLVKILKLRGIFSISKAIENSNSVHTFHTGMMFYLSYQSVYSIILLHQFNFECPKKLKKSDQI